MEVCPLDKLIKHMPLLIQERILRKLIASKKGEKPVLGSVPVNKEFLGWGKIHMELLDFFEALAEGLVSNTMD